MDCEQLHEIIKVKYKQNENIDINSIKFFHTEWGKIRDTTDWLRLSLDWSSNIYDLILPIIFSKINTLEHISESSKVNIYPYLLLVTWNNIKYFIYYTENDEKTSLMFSLIRQFWWGNIWSLQIYSGNGITDKTLFSLCDTIKSIWTRENLRLSFQCSTNLTSWLYKLMETLSNTEIKEWFRVRVTSKYVSLFSTLKFNIKMFNKKMKKKYWFDYDVLTWGETFIS